MELCWNLDALYTSFDSIEFKNDFKSLNLEIDLLNKWAKENLNNTNNAAKKLEEIIKLKNTFGHLITNLLNYCELTMSSDATNEKALQIINQIEDMETELTATNVKLQKWVANLIDLESTINSSALLKEHAYYIKDLKEQEKYSLSEAEETIISKMQNTGSSSWTKLQELLTSTILIDVTIAGTTKKLPLPAIRNLAYDSNPKLRKLGYDAELAFYPKIADSVAASLNGVKGEVITVSKLKGYPSPLEMTLIHSRMDTEILDAMLSAIKESLPIFQKYFKKKAELLGHKNGLPFYEMFAPMGTLDMNFTYEQAANYIVEKFTTFSPKMGDFAKKAFDNNWIDVEPREGKRGGAFCSNLHAIKESRILTNFTGSFSDVITLAHELGHAYHGDCLNAESYLNSDYPMPIAETASTFCETIINQAALKTATDDEAFTILESSIQDATQVVVDILSRFIFEDKVFKRRELGSLSSKEFCDMMIASQKEAYGDGLDPEYLHKYMWLCKSHYYSADFNYYNFPYAFGLLFAKGLYAEYIKSGEKFVTDYDNLLSSTGKNNLADVAVMVGTDIRSIDFWRSSLKIIEADIEKFISLK